MASRAAGDRGAGFGFAAGLGVVVGLALGLESTFWLVRVKARCPSP